MTIYLTKSLNGKNRPKDMGIVGIITGSDADKWIFNSYTQRGDGRVYRDTAKAAIPKLFKGYMVDAPTPKDAMELTSGYRLGVQWAVNAAHDDKIQMI